MVTLVTNKGGTEALHLSEVRQLEDALRRRKVILLQVVVQAGPRGAKIRDPSRYRDAWVEGKRVCGSLECSIGVWLTDWLTRWAGARYQ